MSKAIDPKAAWDYVTREDRVADESEWTYWQLKGLTAREYAFVQDQGAVIKGSMDGDVGVASGTSELWVLRLGLVGVRNFRDGSGQEVQLEMVQGTGQFSNRKVVSDAFLSRVHPADRAELAKAILREIEMDQVAAGKS